MRKVIKTGSVCNVLIGKGRCIYWEKDVILKCVYTVEGLMSSLAYHSVPLLWREHWVSPLLVIKSRARLLAVVTRSLSKSLNLPLLYNESDTLLNEGMV